LTGGSLVLVRLGIVNSIFSVSSSIASPLRDTYASEEEYLIHLFSDLMVGIFFRKLELTKSAMLQERQSFPIAFLLEPSLVFPISRDALNYCSSFYFFFFGK